MMAASKEQPDLLAIVTWVQNLEDPEEQLIKAGELWDQNQNMVQIELAGLRRKAAVRARQRLIDQGMGATEATRVLAERVGQSPQTIARLLYEAPGYGHGDDDG